MGTQRKCACGCGRDLPDETGGRGRPRLYWSPACRTRARRSRQLNAHWIPAIDGELHVAAPDHVSELSQAVLEAANLAGSFRRLSIEEANPRLAAGCELTYTAIAEALARNFPGWDR
jgi:hypothetical protein